MADFDLLHEDRTLLSHLKKTTSVTFAWVKGHYGRNEKPIPHTLNDVAHNLAHDFLHQDRGHYKPS